MKNLPVWKVIPAITSLLIASIGNSANAQLSFSNPLLDFDSILCVARGQTVIDHVCDQYLGCYALPGGSIYIISGYKGSSRKVTDLLADATVEKGRYTGRKLTGGSFISPDLSYDGKTVVFGWKVGATGYGTGNPSFDAEQSFHIFKINIDGTGLVQLTDGAFNDFDPCWLPSGRIVFISTRRGGYGRCHQRYVPTYTLYSMKSDGSDIIAISYHETNEWQPSVDNNGMIVYSRWDYVDRDDCIAHNMWSCFPDGRDPRAWHGNYPLPLTTMEGGPTWPDGRNFRPWSEFNIRSIPNSTKYVATASGHHTQSFGDLIIIDLNVPDDNKMSQITGISTNKTTWGDNAGPWATAWPLSESYYLASYNGDIVFIDKSANRLTVCPRSATPAANLANFKLIDPIPVKPRTPPQDISVQTFEGEREKLQHDPARISVMNVYETDQPFPAGTKIKWIRVIQLIPKATYYINAPQVCFASEALERLPLGIAPVESDGSAHFEAPVDRCLMFQVLDSNFMAVQSMRSLTYVHKGEHLSCLGCHEDKWKTTPHLSPTAMNRAPSKLQTEFIEALPISYYRCVKPVFDAKCAPCHLQQRKGPDMSYGSLKGYLSYFCDGGWPYTNGNINQPIIGGSRTIPGKCGARVAKLYTYCKPSHNNVSLTKDELHRITLWLDCNSNELGSLKNVDAQKRGELVWPMLDFDPLNPLGLEDPTSTDQPASALVTPDVAMVKPGAAVQFAAVAVDLLNRKVETQPAFSWTVSGGGTISQGGLFAAGITEGGPFTVTATANINGLQRSFTAGVTVSTLSGLPLPAGSIKQMLCLCNSTESTCMAGGDTASVENRYVGTGKVAPLSGDQLSINGSTYHWADQTSQDGTWFSNCGDNRTSYASIPIVNTRARTFRIGYTQDDQVTVWMNGARVLSDRNWRTSENLSAVLSMPAGNVTFIVKHTNAAGGGTLALRFADSVGNDLRDLLYLSNQLTRVRQSPAVRVAVAPYTIRTVRGGLKIDGTCSRTHRVELFSAGGRMLAVKSGAGDVHYAVPAASLPPGLVIVHMTVDGKKFVDAVALTGK